MIAFFSDVLNYALQIRKFKKSDWIAYVLWVGLMSGLLAGILVFILTGHFQGVKYPDYVWSIPFGTFIFIVAIAFDTIGHRTTYKEYLKKAEALVHHITIFAGITSVLLLCAAYSHRELLRYPALSLVILSIFYSVIDEALHWHRYLIKQSDRVEMWSHFFIFLGHTIMMFSWWHWFEEGYPGVSETLMVFNSN
ncbi:MAG: hypothetical protein AB7F43_09230 [Bacteriovoracia bacterium]